MARVKEETLDTLDSLDTERVGSRSTVIQGDLGQVEKDFHLEIRQGEGRIEATKWVSKDWSHSRRVTSYRVFRTVLKCMYVGFNGDKCVYAGLLKEMHVHLQKRESLGSYNRPGVVRVCGCCLKFFVSMWAIFPIRMPL
jgi:hypothetical protein